MSEDHAKFIRLLTEAIPNLTNDELQSLAMTADRKANWNVAMRNGEVQASLLRRQRAGRVTEAQYEELVAFCNEIGVNPKIGAELWNTLAFRLANISRAQAAVARCTPLRVEAIRQCVDGRIELNLRPPVRQLLTVWTSSY